MEHEGAGEGAGGRLPQVNNVARPGANLLSRVYIPKEIATVSPTARKYENVTYNESESFRLSNIFLSFVTHSTALTLCHPDNKREAQPIKDIKEGVF